jgi:cysteine-rich repeat protein
MMGVPMRSFAALLAVLLLSLDASAVIIDSGDGTGNTTAPVDDPGFESVGKRGSLTGIYLGYGWVLTAAHVGDGDIVLGGVTYPAVSGSKIVLIHSGSLYADLALFRIDPAPALLPLSIRASAPSPDDEVVMIGQGRNRGDPLSFFNPPSQDDGYLWGTGRAIRWGSNVVYQSDIDLELSGKTTRGFTTDFTRNDPGDECQAATGDSGGAVFIDDGGGWELGGVMLAIASFNEQPASTAVYGNLTFSADLSYYRTAILDIVTPLCGNGYITSDEQCDDGNTLDGDCCSSTCQFEPAAAACDDGEVCSDGDTCDGGGACLPGPPLTCDDGTYCNGTEICESGVGCQPGTPPVLDDGVVCTVDSCDEGADIVVHAPSDALCDNGQDCDGSEVCDIDLDCQPGTPPPLDDGVACTDDSCVEGTGVVNAPNDGNCTNGLVCDGVETCDAINDCQAGMPLVVDDGVACTNDSCVEPGLVMNDPDDLQCDDSDACTADACDEITGCSNTPIFNCGGPVPTTPTWGIALLAMMLSSAGVMTITRRSWVAES